MGRIVNRSELAETLGVALTTVDQWIRDGMPCEARPARKGGAGYRIDLGVVLDWHRSRERENALGDISTIADDEIVRRKRLAELALVEHDLAVKRGAVVVIADVARVWGGMIAAARAKFLGVGNKLGPQVAALDEPVECQAVIDEAVHEALQELSNFDIGEYQDRPDGVVEPPKDVPGEVVGASTKVDRKPVGRRKAPAKSGGKRRTRKMEHRKG